MPNLPTVNVTDQQLNLLIETFAGTYGGPGQPATVQDVYKIWLVGLLKAKVYSFKTTQLTEQHNATLEAALANLRTELEAVIG